MTDNTTDSGTTEPRDNEQDKTIEVAAPNKTYLTRVVHPRKK